MSPYPPPTDAAAAARFVERFNAATPGHVVPGALLRAIGGNSPFLSDLALREPGVLQAIAGEGADAVVDRALALLVKTSAALETAKLATVLRQAKRHVALAAAVADFSGAWTLEQVTGALSDLADATLRLAAAHVMRAAHQRGELRLPHPNAPDRGSGFAVLALGKLGGRELNFSSDVDLILLYDPAVYPEEADRLGAVFVRASRAFTALMEARDGGGYVFRIDLRLRPDPGSTPPVIALPGALAYYESMGQTWERAALIKARAVAGDLALGRRFLAAVQPFIWRRHLDFAALADIRSMKQRMDDARGTAIGRGATLASRILGHNVKLGQGGIREIEFCAQALQLVWGGRTPAMRVAPTLAALHAAMAEGHLPAGDVALLEAALRFLRGTEHRLQMVADRQTHSLPDTDAGMASFARFMGFADAEAFAAQALTHLLAVHRIFAALLAGPAPPAQPDARQPAPKTTDAKPAEAMPGEAKPGEAKPAEAKPADARGRDAGLAGGAPGRRAALEGPEAAWFAGRPRALRSERGRALLRDVLPALRAAIARQPDPVAALARLDEFIHALPAGVQVFSMLKHNPALLDRLADVFGAAPWLADHLVSVPAALEGLAHPTPVDPDPAATLAAQLSGAHPAAAAETTVEDALAVASRFVRAQEFAIAVDEYFGRIGVAAAGAARTAVADAVMAALLDRSLAEHVARYGRIRGGALAVVALGKAGSAEMMAGSDLDLMLIYDHPADATDSDGPRPLPASQYFARAAQGFVSALTVQTRHGPLYAVDMRLRPSGGKGPVAVSLRSFRAYHRDSAWTWERLALTRARVVAGPAGLARRVAAAMREAMRQGKLGGHPADPRGAPEAGVLADTAAMRARLLRDMPPAGPWDVKLRAGGLMEVELMVQALQLVHARRDVLAPGTQAAIGKLAAHGVVSAADAALLARADLTWRQVQGLLRIALGRRVPASPPPPVLEKLLRAAPGAIDEAGLRAALDDLAAQTRAAFTRLIGDIPPP